jgi:hypothetical protein
MVKLSLLLCLALPAWVQACTTNEECQNGGVCEISWIATGDEGYAAPVCNCLSGYWGYDCRVDCDLKCENRGQCGFGTSSDHGGGDVASGEIVCKCPLGFSGPTCGIREIDDNAADSGAIESSSSNTSPMTTSTGGNSSPSAGAKFGIVFSVFLIVGLIGAILLRKRRRSTKSSTMDTSSSSTTTESVQEREFA